MTPATQALLANLQQQAEALGQQLPRARDYQPADTYELLLRQFSAMKTVMNCLEHRIALLDPYQEHKATKELDSLRAANEQLTNELEDAVKTLADLDRAVVEMFENGNLCALRLPKEMKQAMRREAGRAARRPLP